MLSNADIGVFISNSRKDGELYAKLDSLAEYALNSQQAKLSDIISIYKSHSVSDIEQTLKASEKQQIKDAEAQRAAESENLKASIEAEKEKAATQHKYDLELESLKIEGDLRIKEMDVFKFQKDLDSNDNNIPDHLEIEKLKQKDRHESDRLDLEEKKLEEKIKIEKEKLSKQ